MPMGEVVEFLPSRAERHYAEQIRFVCWLVDRGDLADRYIQRRVSLVTVFDELHILTRGTARPGASVRRIASIMGRASILRRTHPFRDPRGFFGRG